MTRGIGSVSTPLRLEKRDSGSGGGATGVGGGAAGGGGTGGVGGGADGASDCSGRAWAGENRRPEPCDITDGAGVLVGRVDGGGVETSGARGVAGAGGGAGMRGWEVGGGAAAAKRPPCGAVPASASSAEIPPMGSGSAKRPPPAANRDPGGAGAGVGGKGMLRDGLGSGGVARAPDASGVGG